MRGTWSRLVLVLASFGALSCGGSNESPSVKLQVGANAEAASSIDGPGGSHLDVPAGASKDGVTIVLSAPATRRPPPAGTTSVAQPLRLEPEGEMFQAGLELTIPITPSSLPPGRTIDDVVVVRSPQGTNAFVPLPTRRNGNAVVAQTEHFSDFLAVVFDTTDGGSPFGTCGDHQCVDAGETCSTCPYDCGLCLPSTAPILTGTTPSDAATNVAQLAPFVLHFDRPTDASVVAVQSADGPCQGTVTLAIDTSGNCLGASVVFSGSDAMILPNDPWLGSANVTVSFSGSLAGTASVGFMVAADVTPPSVVSIVPAQGATGVLPTASVVVTFDEPIDPTSSGGIMIVPTTPSTQTIAGRTVTLAIGGSGLTPGSEYMVSVFGLRDRSGNALATAFNSSFTTIARATIASSVPVLGAVGVHPRQDLVLTYTRDLDAATMMMQTADGPCTGNVQVMNGTSCIGGVATVGTSPPTLTIRANTLPTSATMNVTITGNDVLGIAVDPAPFVFRVSPGMGFAYAFVEVATPNRGNLGGLSGADGLCNGASPGSKAFLITANREPCNTSNCSGGAAPIDWVLFPNTTYVSASGNAIGTTHPTLPIFMSWPLMGTYDSTSTNFYFGGDDTWQPTGNDCAQFVDNSPAMTSSVGSSGTTTTSFLNGGAPQLCDNQFPILCVQQPPATLPATH